MDSILNSIKQLLGINADVIDFDQEIIIHINSAFSVLQQLGVGGFENFHITSATEEWDDYFGEETTIQLVKSYIYLKVRLMFDPPQNSFLVKAIETQITEDEWRLSVITDPYTLTAEEAATEAEEE